MIAKRRQSRDIFIRLLSVFLRSKQSGISRSSVYRFVSLFLEKTQQELRLHEIVLSCLLALSSWFCDCVETELMEEGLCRESSKIIE
jgi:hypothetical protein